MNYLANPEIEIPLSARKPELGTCEIIGDRFMIKEQVASTEISDIYTALDQESGDIAAVKIPLIQDEELTPRVKREAMLTEAFSSETSDVVDFLAAGVEEKDEIPFAYIATDFKLNGSLYQAIQQSRGKGLAPNDVIDAVSPAARVAELLHSVDLLHRDIKPHNIFLDKQRFGHLGDFGNSGAEEVNETALEQFHLKGSNLTDGITLPGSSFGTMGYVPPEALVSENGKVQYTKEAESFAIGATMFHALNGTPIPAVQTKQDVFNKGSEQATIDFINGYDTPRLLDFKSNVPAAMAHMVLRCLNVDPSERPVMGEVVSHLEEMKQIYG